MSAQIIPIHLPEPPILALDANDDLTLWRFDDGSVVLRIGPVSEIGANTILIEAHHVTAVWTALKAMAEGTAS